MKGHDILIRALAKVRDGGVPLTVVTAGDGTERTKVEALASQLGLGPDQVRFLGFRSDVPDLLAAADFFVLPSRMEGLPLAVLEAMSHGLPIVTTRIGGNPEVVTDGEHGLLVPVEDPDALAAALVRFAQDPALRQTLGEAGRKRVVRDFSFTEMTRKYEAIYDHLVRP